MAQVLDVAFPVAFVLIALYVVLRIAGVIPVKRKHKQQ